MKINIIGRHLEITSPLKEFAEKKLQRLTRRNEQVTSINLTLHLEKAEHVADATVVLNGANLHATAREKDMYSSIAALVDKLLIQVVKHKEKH